MIETVLHFRPKLTEISTFDAFDRWYWPVEEMQEFCRNVELPYSGTKEELRNRLGRYFRGETVPRTRHVKKPSSWAKKELSIETEIDQNISFGRNVRGFFLQEIGSKFVCSSDFMNWVKAHSGCTLGDAIEYW